MSNLIAAMCGMYAMWIYGEMPGRAQRLLSDPNSWPSRVDRGEPLSEELLDDEYALLDAFGAYSFHMAMAGGALLWTIIGIGTSFLSFILYVWLTQSRAVAGSLMIFVIPGCFTLAYPFVLESINIFRTEWRKDEQTI